MKAEMSICVTTCFNGYYRNSIIKLNIPMEAAEIIRDAWMSTNGDMNKNIVASFLFENQSVDCTLKINGKRVGYAHDIPKDRTANLEHIKF